MGETPYNRSKTRLGSLDLDRNKSLMSIGQHGQKNRKDCK